MLLTSSLIFSTFALLTASLPTPTLLPRNYTTIWAISGYTLGCSPGGCVYNFNITAPSMPSLPSSSAFTTSCTGPVSEDLENYQPQNVNCADPTVLWKIDILETVDELYVSRQWVDGDSGCTYNVTGTQALTKEEEGDVAMVDFDEWWSC